jgi:hypothetical protein
MMRRSFLVLALGTFVLALFIASVPWAVYLYGLRDLPSNSLPSRDAAPQLVMRALWIAETNSADMFMQPLSPWHWFLLMKKERLAGFRMADYAARVLLNRSARTPSSTILRQLQILSVGTWISRNWTSEEAARTVLAESYFGHGLYGLRDAAKGYFDVTPDELSVSQAAVIVTVLRGPARYSPWCQPERSRAYATNMLSKLQPGGSLSYELKKMPAGPCD